MGKIDFEAHLRTFVLPDIKITILVIYSLFYIKLAYYCIYLFIRRLLMKSQEDSLLQVYIRRKLNLTFYACFFIKLNKEIFTIFLILLFSFLFRCLFSLENHDSAFTVLIIKRNIRQFINRIMIWLCFILEFNQVSSLPIPFLS